MGELKINNPNGSERCLSTFATLVGTFVERFSFVLSNRVFGKTRGRMGARSGLLGS